MPYTIEDYLDDIQGYAESFWEEEYPRDTEEFVDLCDADTIARMTPEEFERI